MPDTECPSGSGANLPSGQLPAAMDLQFQNAELATGSDTSALRCEACKAPIGDRYFHALGHVVCPTCAQRIAAGQQAPPPLSLARAALFGVGAAIGGCLLYALVTIVTGWELALVAIVVGFMVGRAVRYGSRGLGGRPQQILAVVLTYFAITTSFIPVSIYQYVRNSSEARSRQAAPQTRADAPSVAERPAETTAGQAFIYLLLLAAAAPFLSLSSGFSGIISLVIIFIGLQRAWRLTGRTELPILGPYQAGSAPSR